MPQTDTGDVAVNGFPINGVHAGRLRSPSDPTGAQVEPVTGGTGGGDGPVLIVTDRVVPDVYHDPGALGALARALAGLGRDVHLAALARQGPDRSWRDGPLHIHAFASVPLPARAALGVATDAGPGPGTSPRAARPVRLTRRVEQLLDTVRPGLVHGFTGPLLARTVLAAAAARGLATVATCQPPAPAAPPWPWPAAGLAIQRLRWRDTVRQLTDADLATVTSPAMAMLLRAHGLTAHPAYLRTPVDPVRWRAQPGWQRLGPPVIGYAGTLHPDCGVDHLIAAVALMPARMRFAVAVAGAGPARPALQRQAHAAGVGDRLRFFGRILHADMPDFYRRCTLLVAPAAGPQPGTAVVEAMASGLPILTTTPGGSSDLVDDGHTGLLHPAGDHAALARQLETLLLDPDTIDRLAAGALAAAGEHHATAVAERLDGIYRHAAATAAHRRARSTPPEPRHPNP